MAAKRNPIQAWQVLPALGLMAFGACGLLLFFAPQTARAWLGALSGRLEPGGALTMAAAGPKGGYHQFAAQLAGSLGANTRYSLQVRDTSGSIENIRLLQSGAADFALIQGGLSNNLDGLAGVANVCRQYVHIVVPADSAIKSFRELAGRRVGAGPADSGFAALGARVFDFFQFADPPSLIHDHAADLGQAFSAGEIDAAFTVYSLFAPAIEELLDTGYYRLVPIPDAEAAARYLPGVFAEMLPPNLYGPDRTLPGGPLPTLAVNTLLVAGTGTPDAAVRAVLEHLYDPAFLQSARLHTLTEDQGRRVDRLALHEAASAFYRRNDPLTADSFEIASFFLAGLVCLASTAHYLWERRLRLLAARRRRAIRPYFEQMLAFGEAVENAAVPEALNGVLHEMMATQRRAEREWLGGRLQTEDMENLYLVYNIHSRNAFNKITNLQLGRFDEAAGAPPQIAAPLTYTPPSETGIGSDNTAFAPARPAAVWPSGVDDSEAWGVRVARVRTRPSGEHARLETALDDALPEEESTSDGEEPSAAPDPEKDKIRDDPNQLKLF